jgi:hypothetical protein
VKPVLDWLDGKFWQPLLRLLKQGVTPKKLALSVALGAALGVFPMIGSTTILCFVVGHILKLNPIAIQLVNYFTYPLQLALFIPFFHFGAMLFGEPPIPFSIDEIFVRLANEPLITIGNLWTANVRAIVAWLLLAAPVVWITSRTFETIFRRLVRKQFAAPAEHWESKSY